LVYAELYVSGELLLSVYADALPPKVPFDFDDGGPGLHVNPATVTNGRFEGYVRQVARFKLEWCG
jgi:hypothetical protein